MYDYLIVGAGLYGAVAARELTDRGYSCLVVDRRDHIAGNVYTEVEDGIAVHEYGAHIFHTSDEEVWEYVNRFAEFNDFINSPIANFNGELYNLPFNMNTFRQMWGVETAEEAQAIIESQIADLGIDEPHNLEEQALKLVGRDVYEKLVKGYTEKQWGRDCRDLPAFIIKRLPLRFVYDNNYFNDKYQGIPKQGYTAMVERLLEGIEVRTSTDYFSMLRNREQNGNAKAECGVNGCGIANRLIYTGPIDEFFGYSEGHLEYRTLRFEKERLETDDFQHNAVINYTSREVPYTRIIEHKHFDSALPESAHGHTIITREYPSEWSEQDEPYYPVNDAKNTKLYEQYVKLSEELKGVWFGGRLGNYRYYDMDKVIRQALDDIDRFI